MENDCRAQYFPLLLHIQCTCVQMDVCFLMLPCCTLVLQQEDLLPYCSLLMQKGYVHPFGLKSWELEDKERTFPPKREMMLCCCAASPSNNTILEKCRSPEERKLYKLQPLQAVNKAVAWIQTSSAVKHPRDPRALGRKEEKKRSVSLSGVKMNSGWERSRVFHANS